MRFVLVFAVCLLLSFPLNAASVFPSLQFKTLTVNQGLPDNSVKCVFDDRDGFLWFGTKNGLARYDGARFLTFRIVPDDTTSLPDDFIYCVTQLFDGRIAVGGANASVSFLSPNFKFDQTASVLLARNGVKSAITDIVQSSDSIVWIASKSDGLFAFNLNDASLVPVNLPREDGISSVYNLSDLQIVGNNLYVASDASFISVVNVKSRVVENIQFVNKKVSVQSFGTKLFASADSVLWIATERTGIYYLSTLTNVVKQYNSPILDKEPNIVSDIAVVNDSVLLVSYDGAGIISQVLFSDKSQRFFPSPVIKNSLPTEAVWDMHVTSSGDLCVGTYAQGVCFATLKRSPILHFAKNTSLGSVLSHNSVLSIVDLGRNNCLFSTDGGGLYTLNVATQVITPIPVPHKNPKVAKTLLPFAKMVLCGTYGQGICEYGISKGAVPHQIIDSVADKSVWSLCVDRSGDIWCGTLYNGIYKTAGNSVVHYSVDSKNNTLPVNMINSLCVDGCGTVWVGTEGAGPRFFENNAFLCPKGWQDHKSVVYSMCSLPDSSVAVAYKNFGVDIYKLHAGSYFAIHLSLLGNQSVKSLLYDSVRGLFCATDREVFLLNDSFQIINKWSSANGVVSSGFNSSSMALNDDYLLVGSVSGLFAISLSATFVDTLPYSVNIASISFYRGEKSIVVNPKSWLFSFNDTISLKYSDVDVRIDVARLGSQVSCSRFVYRISGLVDDWVDVPDDYSVILPFVKGGDFVFELAIETRSGFKTVSRLYLAVQKPYWEERWFVIVCIFLLILILFAVYVYRDYSHRKHESILQHKVDERTLYIMQQNRRLEDSSKLLLSKNQLLHEQKLALEEQKTQLDESHAKINERNDILEVQQEELERVNMELVFQQKEIQLQAQILSEKNKLLTKSLNYAKRIQDSLFPADSFLKTHLPESFVFFHPKEIVSGDFFWMKELDGKIIVAEVDCTGHGVPGAFMSMIGNAFLNEIVLNRRILDPAEIFYCLNQELVRIFGLGDFDAEAQDDGMDLSLLVIDVENQVVKMSCAMQNIFIVYPEDVVVYSGDIFSIGGLMARFKSPVYSVHTLNIVSGMKIIMASDGYVDQFGGVNKEKYGSERFVHLLKDIGHLPCNDILSYLDSDFSSWLQGRSQLDDVLVVGFEF